MEPDESEEFPFDGPDGTESEEDPAADITPGGPQGRDFDELWENRPIDRSEHELEGFAALLRLRLTAEIERITLLPFFTLGDRVLLERYQAHLFGDAAPHDPCVSIDHPRNVFKPFGDVHATDWEAACDSGVPFRSRPPSSVHSSLRSKPLDARAGDSSHPPACVTSLLMHAPSACAVLQATGALMTSSM